MDLYLHVNQFPYLGRRYAWTKRPEASEVSDMTKSEKDELFDIIVLSWERAVTFFHEKFRTNFVILGNDTPYLHAHLIPRFQQPKNYEEIEFIDPNPKGNYAPYPKKEILFILLLKIKEELTKRM